MENQIQSGATLLQPRLVRLLQCGRKSCGHVLTEGEREWVPSKDFEGARTAVCPECGNSEFYTLTSAGRALTTRDTREGTPREIDPATIEPSPRMGPKMKARILDAKRRALESLPNADVEARRDGAPLPEKTSTPLPRTPCSRFFIAQPGDPVKPHCDQQWTKWEVGDRRGQDRICLTSCKRKAELIRDALEAFHENNQAQ